uniref:Uncharacterized protein n=1 Tax=viral metagenome TaxID=1070528 RepID=A0A6C0E5N2_9ZZZZ
MSNIDPLRAQRRRDEYRRRQDRQEQAMLRPAALIPLAEPLNNNLNPRPPTPPRSPYRLEPPQAASIIATSLPGLLSTPPASDQPVEKKADQGGSRRSVKPRKRNTKKRKMSKMKKRKMSKTKKHK